VRDGRTLGEGWHRIRGGPHAEIVALAHARERGNDVRGATMYVTLEPCAHVGRTPPCADAVVAAGIGRVVIGVLDPNPVTAGRGLARLRTASIVADVADDATARVALEPFARSIGRDRPYVRLKLATSLDGRIAPKPGMRYQLTGAAAASFVHELRAEADAVLVGAETVRVDDPSLTVRPTRARRRLAQRVIVAGRRPLDPRSAVFRPVAGCGPTLVLAVAGSAAARAAYGDGAQVLEVAGDAPTGRVDLAAALGVLREREIASVLCEGGPMLAASLLRERLVDRIDWLVAPRLIGATAVAALGPLAAGADIRFDRVESLGEDALLSGVPTEARCSAD